MFVQPVRLKIIVFVVASGLIVLPIFFERLHSDEVLYWDVAYSLYTGKGLFSTVLNRQFIGHMPLPFVIAGPFSLIGDSISGVRFIAAIFTIGCAILIFTIAERLSSEKMAVISSLLFLVSFQALRFGGRFYLDQFGAFFFLLAVFLLLEKRYSLAGLSAALMVIGREYWLGVYPFFMAYLFLKREPVMPFLIPFILLLTLGLFYTASTVGLSYFYENQAIVNTLKYYLNITFIQENAVFLLQSWFEVIVVNLFIFLGFIYAWPLLKESRLWLLIFPQFVIVSLVYGFIVNGGVTQYPLGLIASMSIFAGYGLKRLWDTIPLLLRYERHFVSVMLAIITFQFIALNIVATKMTLHQNWGIYGFGYKDDAKIISLLREKAAGEYIHGIHGAFVENRSRWNWTDFGVQQAIAEEPDWLITFDNYVRFLQPKGNIPQVEIYHIGPYLVFHSHPRGHLSELIAQTDFPKWKLRK
jgi:hypothetical protein